MQQGGTNDADNGSPAGAGMTQHGDDRALGVLGSPAGAGIDRYHSVGGNVNHAAERNVAFIRLGQEPPHDEHQSTDEPGPDADWSSGRGLQ